MGPLFEAYLLWFDREVTKTEAIRQVLLFMDNVPVHISALTEVSDKLKNTRVVLFPKNTTRYAV